MCVLWLPGEEHDPILLDLFYFCTFKCVILRTLSTRGPRIDTLYLSVLLFAHTFYCPVCVIWLWEVRHYSVVLDNFRSNTHAHTLDTDPDRTRPGYTLITCLKLNISADGLTVETEMESRVRAVYICLIFAFIVLPLVPLNFIFTGTVLCLYVCKIKCENKTIRQKDRIVK